MNGTHATVKREVRKELRQTANALRVSTARLGLYAGSSGYMYFFLVDECRLVVVWLVLCGLWCKTRRSERCGGNSGKRGGGCYVARRGCSDN